MTDEPKKVRSFSVEIDFDVSFTADEIWPDGDAPDDPSLADVVKKFSGEIAEGGFRRFVENSGLEPSVGDMVVRDLDRGGSHRFRAERQRVMSYARWGEDGSQVYVFGTGDMLVCMGCRLIDDQNRTPAVDDDRTYADGNSYSTAEPGAMLEHLLEHRARGHVVPERAFERLTAEIAEGKTP